MPIEQEARRKERKKEKGKKSKFVSIQTQLPCFPKKCRIKEFLHFGVDRAIVSLD